MSADAVFSGSSTFIMEAKPVFRLKITESDDILGLLTTSGKPVRLEQLWVSTDGQREDWSPVKLEP